MSEDSEKLAHSTSSGGGGGGGGDSAAGEVPDPDLDNLLNDALQDFMRPQPPKVAESQPAPMPSAATLGTDLASMVAAAGITATTVGQQAQAGPGDIWTEEFVQQATSQFEQTMRLLMQQQQQKEQQQQQQQDESKTAESVDQSPAAPTQAQTTAVPQVDFSSMAAQFAQFAEAASKSAEESKSDGDFTQCLADTLKQIAVNNEQLQNPPSSDDLSRMFETMGLGGAEGAGSDGGLGALFPLMQVMLENVLSKEVLYSPIKDITDKYPEWLADNRSNLSEGDFTRYNKQYDIMKQVVDLYEEEAEGDSEEVRGQRFEKIMTSMQKLQELGQPPKDLVGDMGPIMSFDPSGNPVLPDLSSLLAGAGDPEQTGGGHAGDANQGEQCCLM